MSKIKKSRKIKFRHNPVAITFVFGSWVECAKCGDRLISQKNSNQKCSIKS
jgi:hypothetical protein